MKQRLHQLLLGKVIPNGEGFNALPVSFTQKPFSIILKELEKIP